MKSKSVDLEINEANDRDNNSNVNLITTITNKYNNFNKKKNKNTNNINSNNEDNVTLLMTKTMIIVIREELVTIKIVTVIMVLYRQNSIEKKTKKKQSRFD